MLRFFIGVGNGEVGGVYMVKVLLLLVYVVGKVGEEEEDAS